jgi:hypothetical protein
MVHCGVWKNSSLDSYANAFVYPSPNVMPRHTLSFFACLKMAAYTLPSPNPFNNPQVLL